jgi:hypothetical protein
MDGTGEDGADNVVRLPRDWLGPPEELVPMGSRARARESEETVPGADDFWGEGAAAVHGAIQPSARHTDAAVTPPAPPAHIRPRRQRRARRPWGFSVSSGPRRRLITRVPLRPRLVAVMAVVACLITVATIGLMEGGGHPASRGRSAAARGSADARQLTPTAGGLPAAGFLNTAWVARAEDSTLKARGRGAARARSKRRRLVRRRRAREHRHEATRQRSSTTSSNPPSTASGSPVTSTPTSPTETSAPSTAPTSTTPAATSAGSAGSSGTHATSTHHSAFGQSGLLGAGHSSGDS